MSLDKEIREALARHSDDVRPREDAWQGVEKGVRRAHAQRVSMVTGGVALIIAAAALVIPQLGDRAGVPPVFHSPGTSGSPVPGVIDTLDWNARVGVQLGFSTKIPKDWRGGWFEGHWDFHPRSLPGLPEGGDTFAVEYHAAKFENGPWADQPRELSPIETVTIDGRGFERRETTDAGPKIVFYAGNWTYPKDEYLLIQLYASNDDLWEKYSDVGEAVAFGTRAYDGSTPVHGKLPGGITVDDHTKAIVKFLDARVEGVGADDLMTAEASEQYAGDQLGLYGQGQPPTYWKRYEIQTRDEVDANSVQFTVNMVLTEDTPATAGGEGHGGSGQIEEIGVGPGKNLAGTSLPSLIRYGQQIENYQG